MLRNYQILVSHLGRPLGTAALAFGLVACGQSGALYLPTGAAAAKRATLPETLKPNLPVAPQPSPQLSPLPATPTSK